MMQAVLITGSGRGLGEALAIAFSQRGHPIILQGRNCDNLKRVQEKLKSESSIVVGDIRDTSVLNNLLEQASSYKLGVLINNAGMPSFGMPFVTLTDEQIDEMIQTNIIAPMKLVRRLYSFLAENSGTIININSICGLEPKANRVSYCVSRWGMRAFASSLRLECLQDGIRILTIYPSRIKTGPEDVFGNEINDVVEKILSAYDNRTMTYCIIDDRPLVFRNYGDLNYV